MAGSKRHRRQLTAVPIDVDKSAIGQFTPQDASAIGSRPDVYHFKNFEMLGSGAGNCAAATTDHSKSDTIRGVSAKRSSSHRPPSSTGVWRTLMPGLIDSHVHVTLSRS